ncbi:hypothetical protein DXA96_03610 [Lachnospiraceae bacterium OF09-33XD]|nr:hypothetical protein DXA96_03610 [Lachnospiraceae bacterium OF09-33XD]
MKLSELMSGVTPDPQFTGFVTNDDYVLAINTGEATAEKDYEVVEMGVAGLDSQMNPITQDKTYIRAGQSTQKTGTQRAFKITGDRYMGDAAQDFMLAHSMKYGTGNAVVVDYVYFCMLTGKGEKGKASIIVNSDGSGNAGESSSIDIDLKKSGALPTEYTYSASVGG